MKDNRCNLVSERITLVFEYPDVRILRMIAISKENGDITISDIDADTGDIISTKKGDVLSLDFLK